MGGLNQNRVLDVLKDDSKSAPRWPQDGSKMAPRWPKKAPRRLLEMTKSDFVLVFTYQSGSRTNEKTCLGDEKAIRIALEALL